MKRIFEKMELSVLAVAMIAAAWTLGCVDDDWDGQLEGEHAGLSEDASEAIPTKGKPPKPPAEGTLGPWGVPDGYLHVYGGWSDQLISESAAQDFPCPFKANITSVWIRAARSGNPTDSYFVTLRRQLDGRVIGRSVDVPVAGVIEEYTPSIGEWVEFPLPTPAALKKGDYFVQLERTGAASNVNYLNWITDWQDPLPDHAGWVKSFGVWEMYDENLSDEFLIKLDFVS